MHRENQRDPDSGHYGFGAMIVTVTITHAERDLWIAVILIAVDDLTGKDPGYARDASDWFYSSEQNVGSFIWVCHLLGVEPTAIRRGLTLGISETCSQGS